MNVDSTQRTESGYWISIKGEKPLSRDVHAEVTVTVRTDGSTELKVRSAEGRSLAGMVNDMTMARDRISEQINERHTRCPLYAPANSNAGG